MLQLDPLKTLNVKHTKADIEDVKIITLDNCQNPTKRTTLQFSCYIACSFHEMLKKTTDVTAEAQSV